MTHRTGKKRVRGRRETADWKIRIQRNSRRSLVNRNILAQYSNMRKEIKDLKDRIKKLDKFLANPPIVSDTVKGTRRD